MNNYFVTNIWLQRESKNLLQQDSLKFHNLRRKSLGLPLLSGKIIKNENGKFFI